MKVENFDSEKTVAKKWAIQVEEKDALPQTHRGNVQGRNCIVNYRLELFLSGIKRK